MDIINVIEIADGIVLQVATFPIVDSERSAEVVMEAEGFFKKLVVAYYPEIREGALASYVEDGSCFGDNDYSIQLVWSKG